MLSVAFKEWAVVCRALASGRQRVILRKGGIAEENGVFRPEFDRFWLYPTHFHEQQQAGIRPEFVPLLAEAEADRPPAGTVRLSHFAEVLAVTFAESLDAVLALAERHILSEATVRQRFAYRRPGLYVFDVAVFRAASPVEVVESPEYAGCKTWVHLSEPLSTAGAVAVG
jgi:hypothetical protein